MDLLIVEDDPDFRDNVVAWMTRSGHHVVPVGHLQAALQEVRQRRFDVAIVDLHLPDGLGIDHLATLRGDPEDLEVIILTGEASVATAVEAMKRGACDYLAKPFPLAELEVRCVHAADRARLRRENRRWETLNERQQPTPTILGDSAPIRAVIALINRVAPSDAPVLIQGETGTGKELAAQAIQRASPRSGRPFVTVNCAALPEQLVESELFGHEKGAFTGAVKDRPGLFELADRGTLFIDEIGELPLALQPKLLRVLEDGSLRRVGSSRECRVDVRLIAATNRDLAAEVTAGRFRQDLLYRINVVAIQMPPLRDHPDDLTALLQGLLPPNWTVDGEVLDLFKRYPWPGNVRQLRNILERASILAEDNLITIDDLPSELLSPAPEAFSSTATSTIPAAPAHPARNQIADSTSTSAEDCQLLSIERQHVAEVLKRTEGNKSEAARLLGIHRRKLYRLLERLGLE